MAGFNGMSNVWTPEDREKWINLAVSSTEQRSVERGYVFSSFPKVQGSTDYEDKKRSFVTSCLAKAMFTVNPIIRRLSLCFYKALMSKIFQNSFLTAMYKKKNFIVLVKGSNAYKLLLRKVENDIEHSDTDIVIHINPFLDDALFEQIKSSIVILVSQVMSRYKKDLDSILFASNEQQVDIGILHPQLVKEFKETYNELLKGYAPEEENDVKGVFVSPFEDTVTRNECSKKSFMILDSTARENTAVRVEVPHLNMCEFIPLKKSPLVVSHNKAINFKRDKEGQYDATFELIRMRLNNMFIINDESIEEFDETRSEISLGSDASLRSNASEYKRKYKIVPADFIDVSIPLKYDAELMDFWTTGGIYRCYEMYEPFAGANIMVPNLKECIRDLTNVLTVYTNTSVKIEKRQKRLDFFINLDKSRRNLEF